MRKINRAEYWVRHHERWKKSGLTQKEYCEQHEVNHGSFKNRVYQVVKKEKEEPRLKGRRFNPVQIMSSNNAEKEEVPFCEIKFSKSSKLTISSKETIIKMKEMMECLISRDV